MNDTDLGWLHRKLPDCWCGARPAPLNNETPTITYMDVNDDGTFYVRWGCSNYHAVRCNELSLDKPNPQLKLPPESSKKIQYAYQAIFAEPPLVEETD